jgi:hypothetical protein
VVLLATSSKMRLYVPSALVSSSSEFSAAPMIDVLIDAVKNRRLSRCQRKRALSVRITSRTVSAWRWWLRLCPGRYELTGWP